MYNAAKTPLHLLSQRIIALEALSPDTVSLETFAILRQLENVFFRLINTFTVNITKGFKDFKRGELKAYQESHRGDLRQLYSGKLSWMDVNQRLIPVPKSLHRPYLISAQHVEELLTESCYTIALHFMTEWLTTISKTAVNDDHAVETLEAANKTIYRVWGTQGYVPTSDRLLPYMVLTDRGQVDYPVRDVFTSISDIQKTAETILTYEKHFIMTLDAQKNLTLLEHLVDGLVTKLEQSGPISTGYVSEFYRLVSTFATFLDAYANYIQAAQILEHCFVLTLEKILSSM